MNYIEVNIQIATDFTDILIAELADIGFESFTEETEGFKAYITENLFDKNAIDELLAQYADLFTAIYTHEVVAKQNWNEVWENSYEPIEVEGVCRVRASFHEPDPHFKYEIVITPKMSFGTGHHETTSMVLAHQLDIDHANKKVLDVGSGTGILAIMAILRGASFASAFDIEEWAAENAKENTELNHCADKIVVRQGTIEDEPMAKYEIVLANINRNILLRDIPAYTQFMTEKAILVVSGFYEHDIEDIEEVANEAGLVKVATKTKNQWASVVFERK
jgi:ribosomal protein L11 methyltransferase